MEEEASAVDWFNIGTDEVDGVVHDGFSAGATSFRSDFDELEEVGTGNFDKVAAPFASKDFFGGG